MYSILFKSAKLTLNKEAGRDIWRRHMMAFLTISCRVVSFCCMLICYCFSPFPLLLLLSFLPSFLLLSFPPLLLCHAG